MLRRRAISVIVSVRNGALTLPRVLTAIVSSNLPRDDYELIVVDDSSADGSAQVAARYADTVVRLTGRCSGAGYARNRGAELAQSEILVFVDADALVQPDTLQRMLKTLSDHPQVAALAAAPSQISESRNLVSRYANSLVNFGERRANRANVGAVGSPCTAIRREAFIAAGMYDEWRFRNTGVEGMELSTRLRAAGKEISPSKDACITLIKRSSLLVCCLDVFRRSVMVARSIGYQRAREVVPGDIIFTLSRQAAAVLGALFVAVVSAEFLPHPSVWLGVSVGLAGFLVINFREFAYFAKTRGVAFALSAIPLHFLMQATNTVGLCTGWILRDAFGDSAPDAAIQAYAEVGVETWPPVPRASRRLPA
jgi:hypothetical protein